MQCSSDGTVDVLSITALEAFTFDDCTYVVVGSGTGLTLVETSNRTSENLRAPVHKFQVFDSQAIHGISAVCFPGEHERPIYVDLLVYGGHALAWIRFRITPGSNAGDCAKCDVEGFANTDLSQWILTGKTMLIDSPHVSLGTILTSHNVLLRSFVDHLAEPGKQKLSHVTISDQLPAFLYSADFFMVTENSYIIASGTAFGEILTWTCELDTRSQTWHTRPWKEFRGHLGSIFGLSISASFLLRGQPHRFLVSSSDDRTIRLWDLSEVERELDDNATSVSNERKSGSNFLACTIDLTTVYAHDSRIWNVDIEVQEHIDPKCCLVTSVGEDGQVIRWQVNIEDVPKQQRKLIMKSMQNDRYHVGKNIWAYCRLDNNVYSGGADGQIIRRRRTNHANNDGRFSQTFEVIARTISNDCTGSKASALKSYRLVRNSQDQFLTSTEKGELLRCTCRADHQEWQSLVQDRLKIPIVLASKATGKYAFFVQPSSTLLTATDLETMQLLSVCDLPRGSISRLDLLSAAGNATNVCLATTYHGNRDTVLTWISIIENGLVVKHSSLKVSNTFMLTSVHYDAQTGLIVCGSRAGAIAIYTNVTQEVESTVATACIRHVHSSDTVTSIEFLKQTLSEDGSKTAFYLTTGKDGFFCVISVLHSTSDMSNPIVRVVHRSESFLGRHLEGAYLISQPDNSYDMILYGFHADSFVVWNETKQMHMMEVACGGAHREWDFNIRTTPNERSEGTLVWTKGKTVNLCTSNLDDHSVIRSGGHGREIKALAVHQTSEHSWLIATGSEDTNIRLFEHDQTGLKSVSVLTKHKAGLQDLKFSEDGQHLMSAAGMEELLAWRLQPVPVIKLGVLCTASLMIADSTADARLMSLDMVTINDNIAAFSYHILAAFSNGKVKRIAYSETEDSASFTVLAQIDMGSICLTQSQFLRSLATTEDYFPKNAIIGGTNGFITILSISSTSTLEVTSTHRIHQNSITTLSIHPLTQSTNKTLIVTGGDDNALALTLSTIEGYKTTIVPNAHAAALTALAVHEVSTSSGQVFAIATAGNDQRVNVWTARVADQKVSVDFIDSSYTNVADISQIAILDILDTEEICQLKVLVVGVGMETVKVKVPSP